MAETANLKLPLIDGSMTADVPRDLNALAQSVDTSVTEALANITVPDATTTTKGIVQLNDTTNSTSTTQAPTANAVKKAYEAATVAQATANAANMAATAAETPTGAQTKVNNAVGPLASLLTGTKTNTVAAINELFTFASNGKTQVAAAITGKGVPASGSDTFPQMAAKIGQIVTGKRYASGTVAIAATSPTTVSGIGFWPRVVFYTAPDHAYCFFISRLPVMGRELNYGFWLGYSQFGLSGAAYEEGSASKQFLLSDGFNIHGPTSSGSFQTVDWYAFE
ncbi:tail fiber-like repeat protein [Fontibacillus phaseoli]|uniref:Tail fiber-like repeat protein n=1 Tax=Fontibacillus phaseoli TaxID=1416533 RepID=A0A369BQN1_9BACL|nr:tail fiber protein [Fontibacillus phaseoli]RCX22968.1 tail fiber-like repeat protein [Fontibacillus phaseoli]